MGHRSKTRRALKWGGAVTCGLFLLSYLATFVWYFQWEGRSCYVDVRSGWASFEDDVSWPSTGRGFDAGWNFNTASPYFRMWAKYASAAGSGPVRTVGPFLGRGLVAPLWPALLACVLLIGVPAACLAWRDRPRPGYCSRCGYNLTGNITGRCPECGHVAEGAER